jgi:hypothetical protein
VSGDLDDTDSKIAQIVANEQTLVRKPEKMTDPNLYYVNGSTEMLDPNATNQENKYVWSEQSSGVGHFAKYAEQRVADSDTENLLIQLAMETSAKTGKPIDQRAIDSVAQEIQQDIDTQGVRRVYDTPSKGVLWGWEVPVYVCTKAIATGTFLIMAVWNWVNGGIDVASEMNGLFITLAFIGLTGGLLIKDLDRPDRFLYVLLRPQWKSWLVRGAYIITGFGGIVVLKLLDNYFRLGLDWLMIPGMILAIFGAIYTAFLFSQARARDLWQSSIFSAVHMLVHALMAGSVVMMLILPGSMMWMTLLLEFSILFNILLISKEILLPHDTPDSRKTVELMTKGYYSKYFWVGIIIGSVAPIILLNAYPSLTLIAGGFAIVGIFLTEFVRIRVPQMIPLS